MRVLIVGHGRMGRLVEQLAGQHACEIAGVADVDRPLGDVLAASEPVDAAIDFSSADAVRANLSALAARKVNVVIGTTGWQDAEVDLRATAAAAGIGVLASANFSLGMNIFRLLVEQAAARYAELSDTGAWIQEAHHAAKKDAPSGTALLLLAAMREAGYTANIDVSSTRAGFIPGTHVVGFDGPAETVTLTHAVRDRSVFAHGALEAARWLKGRRGWFSMRDMIGG
jgi:4-hydroxy-tetrahydrodipicolinate reductase